MSIRFALTKSTTDVLTTVSSTASAINHGVSSLDHLAAAGAAHAKHYRERTERSLQLDSDELDLIAQEDAKHRITVRKLAHEERMKDPAYAAVYSSIVVTKTKPLAVAAE